MSITLITGVPGSGKTLKAVWDHLRHDVGHVNVVHDQAGVETQIPSIVYTNINSLQIPHELIEGGGSWAKEFNLKVTSDGVDPKPQITASDGWKYSGNPESLRTWHLWAKPGAKIYFDEFQKFWPPRPNGSPVPPDIQALDTHRHMGVDFVLITQNCANVDKHILGLVDRHLHVRRVSNMPLAVVYEWDHASKTLNYKNSMTKSPWRYPKQAYKLYKSAELHTKQKRKLPGLIWFVLAGLAGAAYAVPTLKDRLSDRVGKPHTETATATAPASPASATEYIKDGFKYSVTTQTTHNLAAPALPASDALPVIAAPQISGCIATKTKCSCMDTQGVLIDVEPGYCAERTGSGRPPPLQFTDTRPPVPPGQLSAAFDAAMANK